MGGDFGNNVYMHGEQDLKFIRLTYTLEYSLFKNIHLSFYNCHFCYTLAVYW